MIAAHLGSWRHIIRRALALSLELPPHANAAQRVIHGFALTWVVFAIALRDRLLRRQYLKPTLSVALITLAVGAIDLSPPWGEPIHEETAGRVHAPGPGRIDAPQEVPDEDDDEADEEDADVRPPDAAVPVPIASSHLAAEKAHPNARLDAGLAAAVLQVIEQVQAMVRADAGGEWQGHEDQRRDVEAAVAQAKREVGRALGESASHGGKARKRWSWPTLAELYGVLAFVEQVLLAFARDHNNQLSRRLCLATGAIPEQPEMIPTLRLEWAWIRLKLRRAIRGLVLVASGSGPIVLLRVLPWIGSPAAGIATSLWTFYWVAVFAVAAAEIAWQDKGSEQPFFIRATEVVGRVPVIGWMARLYAKMWRWVVRGVRPACIAFERAPYESVGLGLARAISGFPVLNALFKPVVPVAAQIALRPWLAEKFGSSKGSLESPKGT